MGKSRLRRLAFLLLLAGLTPACGDGLVLGGPPATPVMWDLSVPGKLPKHLAIGLGNFDIGPGTWINGSGVAWEYRYQYLSGGVNTNQGWATWYPPGEFALTYMNNSGSMIPVLSYYQFVRSKPNSGNQDPDSKLKNPGTMKSYFDDFKLLMDNCKTYGKTVIIHVEPDFWGFCQNRYGDDPSLIPVAVKASGHPDAVGFSNNLPGFAQTLVHLRNTYGTADTLLALHASHWGAGGDLILSSLDPNAHAAKTGGFFNALGANFELLFHDPSDRDAGWKQVYYNDGGASWWDSFDFARYMTYLKQMWVVTGRRNILWQIPIGNTISAVCNNTDYHYQDNRVQYFLAAANTAERTGAVNAGVIALLFGTPETLTTHFEDVAANGVDDDGGYLRTSAGAYYTAGTVSTPTSPP